MKTFLSYARKDSALARELAGHLTKSGFEVWNPEDEIVPGENWAKKVGKALDESDLMVILLTPKAMQSDSLRQDFEFAIMSKQYAERVFTVIVGPTLKAGKDLPWILLKLPHAKVRSADQFEKVVKQIEAFRAKSELSHSNA